LYDSNVGGVIASQSCNPTLAVRAVLTVT
jgi:hypothetical protein